MRKRTISFLIILTLELFMIPIAGYFINSAIDSKFSTDIVNVEYLKNSLKPIVYKEFLNFKNPINCIGWAGICYSIISFFIGNIGSVKNKAEYEQVDNYGSHGTSRWLSENEMRNLYTGNDVGWFLDGITPIKKYSLNMPDNAAYHVVENKLDLNMQVIVTGPSGSKKTTGFILPNIFNLPKAYKENGKGEMPDFIITDPKPELYPLTARYLEENNYEVRALDFIDLMYGDSINVLEFANDDKTIMQIAKGYIDSVGGAGEKSSNGGPGILE